MASDVENASVEARGYFCLGHGSFVPHNPLRLLQTRRRVSTRSRQQQQQKQKRRLLGSTSGRRQAVSLPTIHVSKLQEKPPRKPTVSLKQAKELLGDADSKDEAKGRLLPSVTVPHTLPKVSGVMHQDSSWWEWSKKDYRIKQTKFNHDSEMGELLLCYSYTNKINNKHNFTDHNFDSISEDEIYRKYLSPSVNVTSDSTSADQNSSPLLNQYKAKPLSFNAQVMPLSQFTPQLSDTSARDQHYQEWTGSHPLSSAHDRPLNNISIFDFNLITAQKPAHPRKWSKLTVLPHIQTELDQMTVPEYHLSNYRWGQFDEGSILSHQTQSLADITNQLNTETTPFRSQLDSRTSVAQSGPFYSIQNITLRENSELTPEHKNIPARRSNLAYHSLSDPESLSLNRQEVSSNQNLSVLLTSSDSEYSDTEAYNRGRFEAKHLPNRKKKISIVTLDSLGEKSKESTRQFLPDLRNAVLINNWIKILESTKETELDPEMGPPSGFGHHVYPSQFKQTLLGSIQDKAAEIDVALFFNQPESIRREFDKVRHLGSLPENVSHTEVSSEGANEKVMNTQLPGSRSLPVEHQPRKNVFPSYCPPPLPRKMSGLANLLAIQALTSNKEGAGSSTLSQDACPQESESKQYSSEVNATTDLEPLSKVPGRNRLEIKVDMTPRGFKGSVNVNPVKSPYRYPDASDNTSSSFDAIKNTNTASSREKGHLEQLLMGVVPPIPRATVANRGAKRRQSKVHNTRHYSRYPHNLMHRRETVNMHPDLVVVGSAALDMEEIRWREEVKALIRVFAKSKSKWPFMQSYCKYVIIWQRSTAHNVH